MARLWIHIENEPRAEKFCVARENPELDEIDLNDISPQLCAIETLKNVQPSKLDFFRYGDRITPLPPDTLINTLNTTGTDPLVVRYPLSDSQEIYPHNSGLWYLICNEVEKKWETLNSGNSQYFFVYSQDKKKSEEIEIKNEFALNKVVGKITPSEGSDERAISLSIRIRGKKAYGDWEIGEVLKKFLHQEGSSIADVRKFKIDELQDPDPSITREEFKLLIDELEKKKSVKHVQSIEERLELKAEEWLDGTYGYGPTDYAVYVESIIALVAEVKKEDFEKGAAQNIVQMCSAVEALTRKRRIDEINDDDGNIPILMYGIVTNALQWYFIRWAGSPEDPIVEVSGPHQCEFDSEHMEQAKKIVGYITSILIQQVRGLEDDSSRPRINKRRQKRDYENEDGVQGADDANKQMIKESIKKFEDYQKKRGELRKTITDKILYEQECSKLEKKYMGD
ncbi:hypothetical protein GLOIN_2v643587 [Rhizophagus clarus]|uniref:Uncharacterized protein n=1 Tax=Rhizophagus clarus TaxID=94130 RepID=A0A8H3LZW5_9GLOM|nr:hypothetical protein GLOIN_2v643587 [Rhizophagus clarus]